MGDQQEYYWCLAHDRVEASADRCAAQDRMGPYPTEAAARDWQATSEQRNEDWDEADEAWEGSPAA